MKRPNGIGTADHPGTDRTHATAAPPFAEEDLRRALRRGEIVPHFQPIIHLSTGKLAGFEALARWHHPDGGVIPPDAFIGLAERSGLIDELGAAVLTDATAFAASWAGSVSVSVNVAPCQLLDPNLVSVVEGALRASRLPADRLDLEITETALIEDRSTASKRLGDLKSLGATVSLDDFGTGYSGLAHLAAFPFDELKIDRAFVSSMRSSANSMAIVDAVLGLARVMGLKAAAEGLEAKADMEFLRAKGCHLGQGFGIGRPLPAEEVRRMWSPLGHGRAARGPSASKAQRLSRLVYVSRRESHVSEEDIDRLLWRCLQSNTRSGITGALILVGDVFVQFLEGDPDTLSSLFAKIVTDRRHTHVRIVGCLDEEERLYPEWSMADLRGSSSVADAFQRHAPTLLDDPYGLTAANAFALFEHVAHAIRAEAEGWSAPDGFAAAG